MQDGTAAEDASAIQRREAGVGQDLWGRWGQMDLKGLWEGQGPQDPKETKAMWDSGDPPDRKETRGQWVCQVSRELTVFQVTLGRMGAGDFQE